jgi:metal-responsive CopG/Arc/MetJ family transcriptional regulator
MQVEKISVSLPKTLIQFIEVYKTAHQCKSRSQVIEVALQQLQEHELEQAYHEANQEIDPDWELTIADGLADETW